MANDSAATTVTLPLSLISQRYRLIQSMVVDYALLVAIIGLNPFRSLSMLTLSAIGGIIFKMIWDIRRKWSFSGRHRILAVSSYLFNLLSALTTGFMALLTLIFISVVFPIVIRFALAAALMILTWIVGAVTNQFFLNSYLRNEPARGENNG